MSQIIKLMDPKDVPEPYYSAAKRRTRDQLFASRWVGCYYCLSLFRPRVIREWVDQGKTAVCPLCGIDSVIPLTAEQFESDFLDQMRAHWFNMPIR